ncbi:MAG: hypothetical protein AB7S38_34525 [Vulcanimicrobiota bacterium]
MADLSFERHRSLQGQVTRNPERLNCLPFAIAEEGNPEHALVQDGQDLVVLGADEHERYRQGRGRASGWRGWFFLKEDTVWASDGKQNLAFNPKGEPRSLKVFPGDPAGRDPKVLRERLLEAERLLNSAEASPHQVVRQAASLPYGNLETAKTVLGAAAPGLSGPAATATLAAAMALAAPTQLKDPLIRSGAELTLEELKQDQRPVASLVKAGLAEQLDYDRMVSAARLLEKAGAPVDATLTSLVCGLPAGHAFGPGLLALLQADRTRLNSWQGAYVEHLVELDVKQPLACLKELETIQDVTGYARAASLTPDPRPFLKSLGSDPRSRLLASLEPLNLEPAQLARCMQPMAEGWQGGDLLSSLIKTLPAIPAPLQERAIQLMGASQPSDPRFAYLPHLKTSDAVLAAFTMLASKPAHKISLADSVLMALGAVGGSPNDYQALLAPVLAEHPTKEPFLEALRVLAGLPDAGRAVASLGSNLRYGYQMTPGEILNAAVAGLSQDEAAKGLSSLVEALTPHLPAEAVRFYKLAAPLASPAGLVRATRELLPQKAGPLGLELTLLRNGLSQVPAGNQRELVKTLVAGQAQSRPKEQTYAYRVLEAVAEQDFDSGYLFGSMLNALVAPDAVHPGFKILKTALQSCAQEQRSELAGRVLATIRQDTNEADTLAAVGYLEHLKDLPNCESLIRPSIEGYADPASASLPPTLRMARGSLCALPPERAGEMLALAVEGSQGDPSADFLKAVGNLALSQPARDSLGRAAYYGLTQLQQAYATDQSLPAVLHLAAGLARQLPIEDQAQVVQLALEHALARQPKGEIEQFLLSLRGLLEFAMPGQHETLLRGALSGFSSRGRLAGTSVATSVFKATLGQLERAKLKQAIDSLPTDDNPSQSQLMALLGQIVEVCQTPDTAFNALYYGLARLDGATVGPALAASTGCLNYIPPAAQRDFARELAALMRTHPVSPEDAALGAYLSQVTDFEEPQRLGSVLSNMVGSWNQLKLQPSGLPPALWACHGAVYGAPPELALKHVQAVPIAPDSHPVARFLGAVAQLDGLESEPNLQYGLRTAIESLAAPPPDGLSSVVMAASRLIGYLTPENQTRVLELALPLAQADRPESAGLLGLIADWAELGANPSEFLPLCLTGYQQQLEQKSPLPPVLLLARDGVTRNGQVAPAEWVGKVTARVSDQGLSPRLAQGVEFLRHLSALPAADGDYRTAAFQRAVYTLAANDPLPAAAALLRESLGYTPGPNKNAAIEGAVASLRSHSDGPDSLALADFLEFQLQLDETTAAQRVTQALAFWEVRQKFAGLPASLALCSAASQDAFSPEQAQAMLERFLPAQDPADPDAAQVVRFLRALDPSNTTELRAAFSAMRWVRPEPEQGRLPVGLKLCQQMLTLAPASALRSGLASLAPGQEEPLVHLLELFDTSPLPAANLQSALAAYNEPSQPAPSPHLLRAASNLVQLQPRPVTKATAAGLPGPLGGLLHRLAASQLPDDRLAAAVMGISGQLTRFKQEIPPASLLLQAGLGALSYLDQSLHEPVYEAVEAELRTLDSQSCVQLADWLQTTRAKHAGPWPLQAAASACGDPLAALMPFELLIGDAALKHHRDSDLAREVLSRLAHAGRDALFLPTARLGAEDPIAEVHRLRADYEQWLKKNPQVKPEKVELEQQEDWVSVGDFGLAIQD